MLSPFINIMHKTDIPKKCNSLHQKHVDITKNTWTSERNVELLTNSNMTPITLKMQFQYQVLVLNTPSVTPISIQISGFKFLIQYSQFLPPRISEFKLHTHLSLPSSTYIFSRAQIFASASVQHQDKIPDSTTRSECWAPSPCWIKQKSSPCNQFHY